MEYMISSKMAVMSHLSDAQELINMGFLKQANDHINFAKRILLKYPNDTQVTENELNSMWKEMFN